MSTPRTPPPPHEAGAFFSASGRMLVVRRTRAAATAYRGAMKATARAAALCTGLALVAAAAETHGIDGRTIIAAALLWAATTTHRK